VELYAQAVPGLTDAGRLDPEIRELLSRRPVSPSTITEKLEELLRWFPYGIDPWVWREGANS
jgi:hypothetical protein